MERMQSTPPAVELARLTLRNTARLMEIQMDTWLKMTSFQVRTASALLRPQMAPWVRWMAPWWAASQRDQAARESADRAIAAEAAAAYEASSAERESVRAARQSALEDADVAGWQQGLSPRAADERGKRRR